MIYFNLKTEHGIETVDQLDKKDFKTRREFILEKERLRGEYFLSGMAVYFSIRCTKDWKEK